MRIWRVIPILFFALLLSGRLHAGGDTNQIDGLLSMELKNLDGTTWAFSKLENQTATVLVLLSPECPLCQNYTLTLNNMLVEYQAKGIAVMGVFPGKDYNKSTIKKFLRQYKVAFPVVLDPDYAFTEKVKGTTTPEAILVDPTGRRLYSGAIDNWAFRVGKKRRKITEHYLKDALEATLHQTQIPVARTAPIGCFIYGTP